MRKANPILRILLEEESLSELLEGRKTSIIRESGVKEKEEQGGRRERWKRADFPASGSDSRFTAFANGREGTEEREKKTEVGERDVKRADPSLRGF